jgi:hypothetical protein
MVDIYVPPLVYYIFFLTFVCFYIDVPEKSITWLSISTGMEIGEFASHTVHGLHLEDWLRLARIPTIVQLCAKLLIFYSEHKEIMVVGERAISHAQTR